MPIIAVYRLHDLRTLYFFLSNTVNHTTPLSLQFLLQSQKHPLRLNENPSVFQTPRGIQQSLSIPEIHLKTMTIKNSNIKKRV